MAVVPVHRTNAQAAGAANVTIRANLAGITDRIGCIATSSFLAVKWPFRGAYDEVARLRTRGDRQVPAFPLLAPYRLPYGTAGGPGWPQGFSMGLRRA